MLAVVWKFAFLSVLMVCLFRHWLASKVVGVVQ
jgi:hypothetical protein